VRHCPSCQPVGKQLLLDVHAFECEIQEFLVNLVEAIINVIKLVLARLCRVVVPDRCVLEGIGRLVSLFCAVTICNQVSDCQE